MRAGRVTRPETEARACGDGRDEPVSDGDHAGIRERELTNDRRREAKGERTECAPRGTEEIGLCGVAHLIP